MNSAGLKGLSQLSPKSCSNPAGENIVLEQDSFVFEPKVGVDVCLRHRARSALLPNGR